jgi:arginyl-tRNA synthetase
MISKAMADLADLLSEECQSTPAELLNLIEIPKLYDHGHLALPLFTLAKKLKKNPMEWAKELAGLHTKNLNTKKSLDFILEVKPVGGFLNFALKSQYLTDLLFHEIQKPGFYKSQVGLGQTVVIDYSSPNVAKPMHIGHMRATVVGQAIRNLAATQSYNVIGVNHLGDWGTQFGKLSWAYLEWGKEYDFTVKPIDSLLKLYVRFHEEAERDPRLEEKAAALFKRLEDGDPEITQIWKMIIEVSLQDFNRLYKIMKVQHDVVLGESFYNDKMEDVIQRLERAHLLKESEGAQVVFFDEKENMPPCIIKKSDGASIYATRDLAAAIYRHEIQKADLLLYVVGVEQVLHFKQVFNVLRKLGYSWWEKCQHINFGRYRFKDGKMASRSGKVIFMEDVLNQAIELVGKMVEEKNPDLANKKEVIEQVAIAAVFFNDLMNDRVKDVEFDWDRIISTEGDSGPYVQYTGVRCKSILRKYGRPVLPLPAAALDSVEEQKLIFSLLRFPETLEAAFRQYKPNILAQYLLELCSHFSHFYHKCRILGEERGVEDARISLVSATQKILEQGLKILNIDSPEAM